VDVEDAVGLQHQAEHLQHIVEEQL
jgi:hypothetical protein